MKDAGVFMVIKNYSGDIMNFEIAQELAEMEGIDVASVVVMMISLLKIVSIPKAVEVLQVLF